MLRRLVVFLIVTVGVLAAAFFGLTRRFTVPANAMEPTMKSGDHVAVFRWFSTPSRKDIVVFFRAPQPGCGTSRTQVERVIGLPGETVEERSGVLSVDGRTLAEGYVKLRDRGTNRWRVPLNSYLVMGDDRRSKCDFRGTVPKKDIVGSVLYTFWPVDRIAVS
jgi:signal peptidase I